MADVTGWPSFETLVQQLGLDVVTRGWLTGRTALRNGLCQVPAGTATSRQVVPVVAPDQERVRMIARDLDALSDGEILYGTGKSWGTGAWIVGVSVRKLNDGGRESFAIDLHSPHSKPEEMHSSQSAAYWLVANESDIYDNPY